MVDTMLIISIFYKKNAILFTVFHCVVPCLRFSRALLKPRPMFPGG